MTDRNCPNCKRWLGRTAGDAELRCRHCKRVWLFDTGRVRDVTMRQLRPVVAR